jgi:hypothetical protein
MSEKTADNKEILYRVNKRKLFYILVGDMLPAGLFLFVSTSIFRADNISDVSMVIICVGMIMFIIGMHMFLSTITFKELIIYKDRVEIKRFIIKDKYIFINNIKSVETISHAMMMTSLFFIYKNERRYTFMLRLSVPSLYDDDMREIDEIIKTLQGEANNESK